MSRAHTDDQIGDAMAAARGDRAASVADDLRSVYAGLQQLRVPVWLKLDLTMAQFKALVTIERDAGASVCEVGRELSIGESAASLLTDQLVRRGDVERVTDPHDRRRVRLTVTPHGQALLDELRQGGRQIMSDWLDGLDDDELEALARGLRALARAAAAAKGATTTEGSATAEGSLSKEESVNV